MKGELLRISYFIKASVAARSQRAMLRSRSGLVNLREPL